MAVSISKELTTVTNRMQQQCEVIILGDLNAKIAINKQQCKQKLSRNGSLLQEFLKQTNTVIINTTEKHQGTWTRVNRRNNSEKSVIDYIITGYPMKTKVVESATDTDNMYQIAGINQTDHNVITATINTEIAISSTTTRKWKKGTEDEWIQCNQELQKKWNNTRSENRKYTTLQNQIISCLQSTIGSNIIKSNRKEKITNPNIKDERQKRKQHRTNFEQACREGSRNKASLKHIYIESQLKVKSLIEKQIKEKTQKKVYQIIKEGGVKSSTFWNIRKQLLNHNKNDAYETRDEEGKTIENPEMAKEHIADYFENLYQAREGEKSHEEWTEHINKTVDEIDKKARHPENQQPLTLDELTQCIRKLKRKKSTGPDTIPMKYS